MPQTESHEIAVEVAIAMLAEHRGLRVLEQKLAQLRDDGYDHLGMDELFRIIDLVHEELREDTAKTGHEDEEELVSQQRAANPDCPLCEGTGTRDDFGTDGPEPCGCGAA